MLHVEQNVKMGSSVFLGQKKYSSEDPTILETTTNIKSL